MVCAMPHVVTETVENNEFLKCFKNFNSHRAISIATKQDIDEFVDIDNQSTHVFHENILKEANFFWRTATSKWKREYYIIWGWANGCWYC